MKVLLDSMMPVRIRYALAEHTVTHVVELGWQSLSNGRLLATAEQAGFDVLLTKDTNMPYQQNLSGRTISLVVVKTKSQDFDDLVVLTPEILKVLRELKPGIVTRIPT